jgi:hypothetical protein
MKKILGVTLGIMTALGGFVDLGQIRRATPDIICCTRTSPSEFSARC